MSAFDKLFTQQEPISELAIQKAIMVMESGRLHRYNSAAGEPTETDLLEQEFADYLGSRYCLACTSGGFSLQIALRSVGVQPSDVVLSNGFTLAPVPGAIHNVGGHVVLVETAKDYTIDLDDLCKKAEESGARFLLLSHMRGHIANMDSIMEICERYRLCLIEDCAHTLGAQWDGQQSGAFGQVSCFSTQTYKHLNSGEGGLLITDDEVVMAKAIMYSGSYMHYHRHLAAPAPSVFEQIRLETPNFSGRMDNLRAAVLRPQLEVLDQKCHNWNKLYGVLDTKLRQVKDIWLPPRSEKESFVGSSIQFSLLTKSPHEIETFVKKCADKGVTISWFGANEPKGYTSRYDSWQYISNLNDLPKTRQILSTMCDMRIPLTFTQEDCVTIASIIADTLKLV